MSLAVLPALDPQVSVVRGLSTHINPLCDPLFIPVIYLIKIRHTVTLAARGALLPVLETFNRDGLHLIALNRPGKLNALNRQVWEELTAELRESCKGDYNGLVITG